MIKSLDSYLQNTVFLSSMMGVTDSEYCSKCGQGADMVQLGALIAAHRDRFAEDRKENPEYFLSESEAEMTSYFTNEINNIKENLGEITVALNIGIIDIEEGVKAARAWEKAGGDIFELNIHGNWQDLREKGYLRGMALPEYRERLLEWTAILLKEDITLYLKFNSGIDVDFDDLLDDLQKYRVPGYHFNIRGENGQPRFDFLRGIVNKIETVLLCSGYIRSPGQVKRLWEMGVDSVGFAQPVLDDCEFIKKISDQLSAN